MEVADGLVTYSVGKGTDVPGMITNTPLGPKGMGLVPETVLIVNPTPGVVVSDRHIKIGVRGAAVLKYVPRSISKFASLSAN